MSENKNFTGFKFIDEKLGGLLPNKLCCIGGENDPISAEQLSLSILKGITDNNPDGVVFFVNHGSICGTSRVFGGGNIKCLACIGRHYPDDSRYRFFFKEMS